MTPENLSNNLLDKLLLMVSLCKGSHQTVSSYPRPLLPLTGSLPARNVNAPLTLFPKLNRHRSICHYADRRLLTSRQEPAQVAVNH